MPLKEDWDLPHGTAKHTFQSRILPSTSHDPVGATSGDIKLWLANSTHGSCISDAVVPLSTDPSVPRLPLRKDCPFLVVGDAKDTILSLLRKTTPLQRPLFTGTRGSCYWGRGSTVSAQLLLLGALLSQHSCYWGGHYCLSTVVTEGGGNYCLSTVVIERDYCPGAAVIEGGGTTVLVQLLPRGWDYCLSDPPQRQACATHHSIIKVQFQCSYHVKGMPQ